MKRRLRELHALLNALGFWEILWLEFSLLCAMLSPVPAIRVGCIFFVGVQTERLWTNFLSWRLRVFHETCLREIRVRLEMASALAPRGGLN